MPKDQFELIFDHLFEEAVQESYELAGQLPLRIKDSWESVSKKIEEQLN